MYDPTEIAQHMLTEGDEAIRAADVPERLQPTLRDRRLLTESELREEAEWIYARLFSSRRVSRDDADEDLVANRISSIERVLTYVYQGEQVGARYERDMREMCARYARDRTTYVYQGEQVGARCERDMREMCARYARDRTTYVYQGELVGPTPLRPPPTFAWIAAETVGRPPLPQPAPQPPLPRALVRRWARRRRRLKRPTTSHPLRRCRAAATSRSLLSSTSARMNG